MGRWEDWSSQEVKNTHTEVGRHDQVSSVAAWEPDWVGTEVWNLVLIQLSTAGKSARTLESTRERQRAPESVRLVRRDGRLHASESIGDTLALGQGGEAVTRCSDTICRPRQCTGR